MNSNTTELITQLEQSLHLLSPSEREQAISFLQKQRTSKARDDFYVYVRSIAPLLLPEEFRDGRHIHLFCNELEKLEQAVVRGEKYKLQFWLPPGAMKTLILCLFVSWLFGRHPEWYVIHIGHTAKFAEETFGQRIRDIILLPEYSLIFPETKISRTTRSKATWKTTSGGVYNATGAGNAIAGKRAKVCICLEENSIVLTENGWKSLKEINNGDCIFGRKGFQKIDGVLHHHRKVCYHINNEVKSSEDHPFYSLTKNMWVEAKDLKIGDKIRALTIWEKIYGQIQTLLIKAGDLLEIGLKTKRIKT